MSTGILLAVGSTDLTAAVTRIQVGETVPNTECKALNSKQ
jgi:hypothetical protein